MKDLLNKYTDKEILERFFEMYPDQKDSRKGYELVIKLLRLKRPRKSNFIIHARKYDVDGICIKTGEKWAIEFTTWSLWLGSKMKRNSLDALCACLWEMTYMGFSERKIQNTLRTLNNRVKSIKGGEDI